MRTLIAPASGSITPPVDEPSLPPSSSSSSTAVASPALVVHKADRGSVEGTSLSVVCNDLTMNVAYDPILCLAHFLARPLTSGKANSGGADVDTTTTPSPLLTSQDTLPPPPPATTPVNDRPIKTSQRTKHQISESQQASERRGASTAAVSSIRRYKLLLHHPRVFLWENEAAPSSRVLVLKGLVVFDGKIQTSADSQHVEGLESGHSTTAAANGRCVEAFSARVEKLESFIVANGHAASTNEMSLLEPLSMHLSLERSSQPLYPTKREVSVSIEPIALRCSYRDVQVLKSLLALFVQ